MKAGKRFMSILLSMIMLISLCSGSVLAAEEDKELLPTENSGEWIITEMSALDETVVNQVIPQMVKGIEPTTPALPETLEATAYQLEEEPQSIQVEGITWTATPEYDQKTTGEYIYTPVLPEKYVFADGIEIPRITVTVKDSRERSDLLSDDDGDRKDTSIENQENAAPIADSTLVKENEVFTIDEITYTIDLHSDGTKRWAYLWQMEDPAAPVAVTLPSSVMYENEEYPVTEIAFSQWDKCNNVTELILPDTLTTVNSSSFYKFPNLTEMTIPGSIKNFGGSFQNMSKLETITFCEGVEEISSNSMVNRCEALTTINLPATLKCITQPAAFGRATALTGITLPEGLVVTESSLFSGCTSLLSVELPASMTEIPSSTFSGCTSLESVTAKGTITSIGSSAFNECAVLKTIPDLSQVTKIESYAFNECGALPGPVDLSNVTEMGANAFYNCQKLTGALDLTQLNVIPNKAFSYTSVDSVTLSDNLTSIGTWAFLYTEISEITFPETLTSIGTYAFWNTKKLSGTVRIPDSVTSIGNYAFSATVVEIFEIGSGVESLNANVFEDNNALQKIVFDNSQDNVTITGTLSDQVAVEYTQPSIEDSVGDTISDTSGALTLQEAVNKAAQADQGGQIILEKNIKLKKAVTVPAGRTVTISAEQEYQIAGTKTATDLKNLFIVEEGGSLVITGQITLFGRYNRGSIILNKGTLELTGDAVVTGSKIVSDSANGTGNSGLGIIDSRGEGAVFKLSGGKIIKNALHDGAVAYSGIVRVSDGAAAEITGGEISGNNAAAAAALNCSSGMLLYGNASAVMSGGTISGNTGHRGSAVMLWGYDEDHRTTFTLSENGTITGNTCTDVGKTTGSGAVHVENNALFTMNGGSISANKGGNGAGVCVVDGNLQNGQTEYKTAFNMEGGTISENTGRTGGGIYSYSNGVDLKAGEIVNNKAFNMGGGIYSEGNYDYYSTLHLSNALITANTARQGGGMWFCATGKTNISVTEGAAIFENSAQDTGAEKGVGDDFVFAARSADNYPATLANRLLGGGAVQWYKDGSIYLPSTGVYPTTNEAAPRYGMEGADPNPVTVTEYKECLALKAVPVSEEYKAVAKKEAALVISGNMADKGGGIGSNGGVDIGTGAVTEVNVNKVWLGDNEKERPESITVNLLCNNQVIDTAELTAAGNWSHTFTVLPTVDRNGQAYTYTISEVAVPGYTAQISGDDKNGFTISNTKTDHSGGDENENHTHLKVQKVWTLDDGGKASASVQVELLCDGQRYAVVELNADNGWQYTWEQLNDKYKWSVVEINVPEGFTSAVSQKENIWTITNDDVPKTTDPTNPQKPTDPQTPTDPTDPQPPTDPTDPQKPTNPTDPQLPTDPADPQKPTDPSKPADSPLPSETSDSDEGETGQPATGDQNYPVLWMLTLVASGAGIIGITMYSRKKRRSQ
ncbi:putative uncharacterized protein [Lachnospiraceae bacterium CAG:215]|nr:putative uncharacterized protein [Lachnospiraceae bacterium CAG:215]